MSRGKRKKAEKFSQCFPQSFPCKKIVKTILSHKSRENTKIPKHGASVAEHKKTPENAGERRSPLRGCLPSRQFFRRQTSARAADRFPARYTRFRQPFFAPCSPKGSAGSRRTEKRKPGCFSGLPLMIVFLYADFRSVFRSPDHNPAVHVMPEVSRQIGFRFAVQVQGKVFEI